MRLGPHTVVVVRAAEVASDYGNQTSLDWQNATETTVSGCSVQPAPSDEFTVDRDVFITRWQVFAPASADVRPADRIKWQDHTYEVVGDVLRWDFGGLSHLVINLQRSDNA